MLALIIDVIIVGIIGGLVAFPWLRDVFDSYSDWFDEALNADSSSVDTSQLQSDTAGPLAIIGAINLALGFAYHVGFLMWKQATPGKLILGLRVRLRETPGPMPIGTVLLRWARAVRHRHHRAGPVRRQHHGIYSPARLPVAAVGRQEAGDPRQDREDQRGADPLTRRGSGASPGLQFLIDRRTVVRSAAMVRQSLYGWL